MTDRDVVRCAAIDTIVAARHAALDDLGQVDAATRRIHDAVVRITASTLLANELSTPPAHLEVLVSDARALQEAVRSLTGRIARVDQWGKV